MNSRAQLAYHGERFEREASCWHYFDPEIVLGSADETFVAENRQRVVPGSAPRNWATDYHYRENGSHVSDQNRGGHGNYPRRGGH